MFTKVNLHLCYQPFVVHLPVSAIQTTPKGHLRQRMLRHVLDFEQLIEYGRGCALVLGLVPFLAVRQQCEVDLPLHVPACIERTLCLLDVN